MDLAFALRLTEILLALALIQQSAEHVAGPQDERRLFTIRLALAVLLLVGIQTDWVIWALMALGILILRRFDGPYNGGSDRLTLLILICLSLYHLAPTEALQELALAYLAFQLVLSYFVSGLVKVANPNWRDGSALADVFAFSAYPVSEGLRGLAVRKRTLFLGAWLVMLFEVAFPLALLHPTLLAMALVIGASFHVANACLFGLNRFVWVWISAYPILIWFQGRIMP